MYLIVTDLIVDLIVELIVCSRRHTARYFKLSSAESLAGRLCPACPGPHSRRPMYAACIAPSAASLIPHLCVSPRCGASCRRSADQCAGDPELKALAEERQAAPVKVAWAVLAASVALPEKSRRASGLSSIPQHYPLVAEGAG